MLRVLSYRIMMFADDGRELKESQHTSLHLS